MSNRKDTPAKDDDSQHDSSEGSTSSGGPIAILEEKVDEGYEPTEKEITDYAEWLGMDAEKDKDLLWIAAKGLKTPLPKPWQPCESAGGDIFYFNPLTGDSKWDHPCDDELRALYREEKRKRGEPVEDSSKDASKDSSSTSPAAKSEVKDFSGVDSSSPSLEEVERKADAVKNALSLESIASLESIHQDPVDVKPEQPQKEKSEFDKKKHEEGLSEKKQEPEEQMKQQEAESQQQEDEKKEKKTSTVEYAEIEELESIGSSIYSEASGKSVDVEGDGRAEPLRSFSYDEEDVLSPQAPPPPAPSLAAAAATTTASAEDLTGKALPPPPEHGTSLPPSPNLRRGSLDASGGLASLKTLAPLGPLPPLSLPPTRGTLPLAAPIPSANATTSKASSNDGTGKATGLDDLLGSPLDLLAGIGALEPLRPAAHVDPEAAATPVKPAEPVIASTASAASASSAVSAAAEAVGVAEAVTGKAATATTATTATAATAATTSTTASAVQEVVSAADKVELLTPAVLPPKLPPKPPVLSDLSSLDSGTSGTHEQELTADTPVISPGSHAPLKQLESPDAAGKPDEMLTPPLEQPKQESKEAVKSLAVPAGDLSLSVSSPPTPQLASILAAELRPEDQLSLWSQIDDEKEDPGKASTTSKQLEPAQPKEPANSLDYSSLSAVLEEIDVSKGHLQDELGELGDASMLDLIEASPSPPRLTEASPAKCKGFQSPSSKCAKDPSPSCSAAPTSEAKGITCFSHQAPSLGSEACSKASGSKGKTTSEEVVPSVQATSPTTSSPGSPTTRCRAKGKSSSRSPHRILVQDADQTSELLRLKEKIKGQDEECQRLRSEAEASAAEAEKLREEHSAGIGSESTQGNQLQIQAAAVAEVISLMGSCSSFRDTVKMSWDEATGRPSLAPSNAAQQAEQVTSVAESASQKRIAQLEAELSAVAARLKCMEAKATSEDEKSDNIFAEDPKTSDYKKEAPIGEAAKCPASAEKVTQLMNEKVGSAGNMDILTPTELLSARARAAQQNDAAELQKLRWEHRELREETTVLERQLADSRHEFGLEQGAHSSTKVSLRESQREVLRLKSQFSFHNTEVERLTAELQKCHAEIADHETQVQQLQVQLQAKDTEISSLRQKSAAQAQRLDLHVRERVLREKEMNLEEKVQMLEEAEARISRKSKQSKTDAEVERSSSRTSRWPMTARANSMPPGGRAMQANSPPREAPHPSSGIGPTSPGSGLMSSTASLRDIRCLTELSAEDGLETDAQPDVLSASRKPSASMPRCCSSARLGQDMSEALRARRRELRREHAELEEDRKQWREEIRKFKKSRNGQDNVQSLQLPDSLAGERVALDARAATLNKSIAEYRSLQQLTSSSQPHHRNSSTVGLAGLTTEPLTAHAASYEAPATARTVRSSSASAILRSGTGGAGMLKDEELFKRWQHVLGSQKQDHLSEMEDASKGGSIAEGRRASSRTAIRGAALVGGA